MEAVTLSKNGLHQTKKFVPWGKGGKFYNWFLMCLISAWRLFTSAVMFGMSLLEMPPVGYELILENSDLPALMSVINPSRRLALALDI